MSIVNESFNNMSIITAVKNELGFKSLGEMCKKHRRNKSNCEGCSEKVAKLEALLGLGRKPKKDTPEEKRKKELIKQSWAKQIKDKKAAEAAKKNAKKKPEKKWTLLSGRR